MRKVQFAVGEHYHAYNRGVDKRDIFLGPRDYERFLYHLFSCNDTAPLLNSQFHYRGLASIVNLAVDKRNRLVDIVCFCLMSNHFHLLLRQRLEDGISKFMQKMGTAYTMYFNTGQQRNGSLFQGTFKAKHIDQDIYLKHLTRYIHLNPLEFFEHRWKDSGIVNINGAMKYIREYPWSSYRNFVGENKYGFLLDSKIIKGFYANRVEYEQFVKDWTAEDKEFLGDYTIEV